MKMLTREQIKNLIARAERAAERPDTWEVFWEKENVPAVIELPTGELLNPNIELFVWYWGRMHLIERAPIKRGDRLAAQGLEGKVRIRTDLVKALNVAKLLPEFRYQIFV